MYMIVLLLNNYWSYDLNQVMFITEPDQWSAAAVYQATRIFVSNLNAKMAQR